MVAAPQLEKAIAVAAMVSAIATVGRDGRSSGSRAEGDCYGVALVARVVHAMVSVVCGSGGCGENCIGGGGDGLCKSRSAGGGDRSGGGRDGPHRIGGGGSTIGASTVMTSLMVATPVVVALMVSGVPMTPTTPGESTGGSRDALRRRKGDCSSSDDSDRHGVQQR